MVISSFLCPRTSQIASPLCSSTDFWEPSSPFRLNHLKMVSIAYNRDPCCSKACACSHCSKSSSMLEQRSRHSLLRGCNPESAPAAVKTLSSLPHGISFSPCWVYPAPFCCLMIIYLPWITTHPIYNVWAMIRHQDWGNLLKKAFNWARSFRGWESTIAKWRSNGGDSWELTLKEQTGNRKHKECQESWNLKAGLQRHMSFNKAIPPNSSQTVAPTEHQVSIQTYKPVGPVTI